MDKTVDLDRYSHEINKISNKLNQLEKGRVYEITDVKGDGYISTNVNQLRNLLIDLLDKIENNEESFKEKISKYFKEHR